MTFKKVCKYSDLVQKELELKKDETSSHVLAIEYAKQIEGCTIPFINYIKSNEEINIKDVVETFVSAFSFDMINVLNILCGSDRFYYKWSFNDGYNQYGYKNAYMIDKVTKEKFYLG